MTGPKTFNAKIRKIHENELSRIRNRRYRARLREGYARTGPVDIPPEIVWVLIENGILRRDDVSWDSEKIPRVDPEVMTQAVKDSFGLLSRRSDDLSELLRDEISCVEPGGRRALSIPFLNECGLPPQARLMPFDRVVSAIEKSGWEIICRKKPLSED